MRIAILGWGSLINEPGELAFDGEWRKTGPKLPIEFSRLSTKGDRQNCLTLVIDTQKGEYVPTRFTISTLANLTEARENLRIREKCPKIECIGYVNLVEHIDLCKTGREVLDTITPWAINQGFEGVIWTDLSSNFKKELNKPFNVTNAIEHLKSLDGKTKKNAQEYIRKAPAEVDTPLRREIKRIGWLEDHQCQIVVLLRNLFRLKK